MDNVWSILIGVFSAAITVFLTSYLTYFFGIQHKKSEYRENAKRELIERLNKCLNLIPFNLSSIGMSLGFTPTKKDAKPKSIEMSEDIESQVNAFTSMRSYAFDKLLSNSEAMLVRDFNNDFLKLSNAWIEFLELRTYMRSRKILQNYYKPLEQFFCENTALISDFTVLAKSDYVEKIKKGLIELLKTEVGAQHSAEQKILIYFFNAIYEWNELLKSVEEKVISEIKY